MTTNHYLEAEKLLELAKTEPNLTLAALFASRAQAHATLATVAPEEPPTIPLRDAYSRWGDCVVEADDGALANVADESIIWICLHGIPIDQPVAFETAVRQTEPVKLVARLAPWPEPEPEPQPEAVPLYRAAKTWGDDIEVQSLHNPDIRWRVRGGKFLAVRWDRVKWRDLTEKTGALVTLASREPYRDDPWAPGQDVTARLMAGETAPEGTILRDCEGDLYRVTQSGRGTMWSPPMRLWSHTAGLWAWGSVTGRFSWANFTPIRVATPDQIRAAGIEVQS